MSNGSIISPMAFVPNHEIVCKLYYVGFPESWKEKLIKVEKISKSAWNETRTLPTNALKDSLVAWADGMIALSPMRANSKDEMWAISCEQEINVEQLYEHIEIWLHAQYLGKEKLPAAARAEIQELLDTMCINDLRQRKGSKEVRLFDENGTPLESYSYPAFSLMITNALVGKSIEIDGHNVIFNYAGKNQLISNIQGEDKLIYSYGISFSIQTIPPKRKSLLVCDCSIHRWIPGQWQDKPFLSEKLVAHVWVGNNRIYKIPMGYNRRKACCCWKEEDEKCYNLYQYKALPKAEEWLGQIAQYLSGDPVITCLYKNGMDSRGFAKNEVGTGVSVVEKKHIYDSVLSYISDMVHPLEGVERVTLSGKYKNASRKLNLDEIKFSEKLTDEQKNKVAHRIRECIASDRLNLEVYYRDDAEACADALLENLENIFQTTKEITFSIKKCKLGSLAEPLEANTHAAIMKRIREIDKSMEDASDVTACLVLLPGKEKFTENDPKDAIRCGFALKKRLTQFITPWDKKDSKSTVDNKRVSAIEDLCRQLGYVRKPDAKLIENKNALVHSNVVGIHVMANVKAIHGSAAYLPLCVELDYVTGQIYVECDAFEQVRVPYREAAFELAKLSIDKEFESKCKVASNGWMKQKMITWKNVYQTDPLLVLMEANENTRRFCKGITDGEIQTYRYRALYCPEELEVGSKEKSYKFSLNDSKVRFIRIRRNAEVPDYFTEQSKAKKKTEGATTEKYVSANGIFKYEDDYWSVAERPNDTSYTRSYFSSKYNMPDQKFAERDMMEIYPIQLQEGDNPDEWVYFANSLRMGAIQYNGATVMPLPLHLAAKLQEYILRG